MRNFITTSQQNVYRLYINTLNKNGHIHTFFNVILNIITIVYIMKVHGAKYNRY